MIKTLTTKAKEAGVKILLRTPAKRLIVQDKTVTGVVGEDPSGEPVQATAKAVIIATGGFGDNPKMIKKFAGYEHGKDLFSFRIPGLAGDGITMAWEAGAGRTDMTMELVYGMTGELEPELLSVFREPHLLVNQSGERFMNEDVMRNPGYTGNAIALQKDKCAFQIFDQRILHDMEQNGLDCINHVFSFTGFDGLTEKIDGAMAAGADNIFKADSLEALAEKAGIDGAGLVKTVQDYNDFCESGVDRQLNKNPPLFAADRHPPILHRPARSHRLRHPGRYQDQSSHRSVDQKLSGDLRTICRRHRCLLHFRRQLRVCPAGQYPGFCGQQRPHLRRKRRGVCAAGRSIGTRFGSGRPVGGEYLSEGR